MLLPFVLLYFLQAGHTRRCAFYDESRSQWSTEGCRVVSSGEDSGIVCKCDHLTNFAILLSENVPEADVRMVHDPIHNDVIVTK